jgi:hypothetical protein
MNILLRYTVVSALAVAMAGYGASVAVAQDFDDDFEDDFGDEDFGDEDFDDDDFDDFDDDFDDDLGDEPIDPAEPTDADADADAAPLTLNAGEIRIDGFIGVNLSSDAVAEPISIAPDVYYGVTDEITVGLVHSFKNTVGFYGFVGDGLCITGEDNGCAEFYNNVGVDGLYQFMDDDLELAANAGLFLGSFIGQFSDPLLMQLKLGVVGRWTSDDIQVIFSPNLFLAATERDFLSDTLNIPVTVAYSLTPELDVLAQTGFNGALDAIGDTWSIPLSVGASYAIDESLSVGGTFSFPELIGEDSTTDIRTLNIFASYAL